MRKLRSIVYVILVACIICGCGWKKSEPYYCRKVINGDKFVILDGNKEQIIQLAGVDTPDLSKEPGEPDEFYSREALSYLKSRIEGQEIYLEFGKPKVDVFKQWRAYVYLKDGTFMNLEMLKQGYAAVFTYYEFPERSQFLTAQYEATKSKNGMWQGRVGRFSVVGGK